MTAEVKQRCLEPFFTTKGDHGTGLGLAMVFGIIKRHQGTLEIESEPDKGTTVRVRLPAAVPPPNGTGVPRVFEDTQESRPRGPKRTSFPWRDTPPPFTD